MIIIFSALLFKDRSLKTSNFRNEHKTPLCYGGFLAWALLVLLVLLWPDLTWFPLKGNAAVFWITCGIVRCFCLKVLCLQTHRCHVFKASYFVPDSQNFNKKKETATVLLKMHLPVDVQGKAHLSENSLSDIQFEIFPPMELRATLWCLAFLFLKTLNFEMLSFKFQFFLVPYKFFWKS